MTTPELETCGKCMGSGYGGHPDSGVLCPDCNGSGGVPSDPLSPARVEAMARELCRIKGLDADGPHAIWSWPNAKDPDLLKQCREFIAMQLAYERTKG